MACGRDFEADTVADAPVSVCVASVKALRCPRCDAPSSRLVLKAPTSGRGAEKVSCAPASEPERRPFECRWTKAGGNAGISAARRVGIMRMIGLHPSEIADGMRIPVPRSVEDLRRVVAALGGIPWFWRDVDPESDLALLKRILDDEGESAGAEGARTKRAIEMLQEEGVA